MKAVVRPLLIALGFTAGILLADSVVVPPAFWAASGGSGVLALALAALLHRRLPKAAVGDVHASLSPGALALVIVGSVLVASGSGGLQTYALSNSSLPKLDGRVVSIEGSVSSDTSPAGRGVQFFVRVEKVESLSLRERLSVRAFGKVPPLDPGDRVRMDVKIQRLDLNESWDRSLHRKKVVAKATAVADQIRVIDRTHNPLLMAANGLRTRMNQLASRALEKRDAGLLLGLTIGDERMIPQGTREEFRATNLSHLTAVSGANVAMVLGAVVLLLRWLRVSRRNQIVIGLATIGFFALVTRGEPSVLRASVMASLVLVAFLFGRRHDPLHGLVLAFIALLAVDPFLLWSVGFQLSFAAAAGILMLTPRLLARMGRLPRPLAEALSVGIGAQVAVFPLLAFHFGKVSLVGIPANLAAFPLVAPITILGFAGGLAGVASGLLGSVFFEIAGPFVRLLRGVAHVFAAIPGASIEVSELGIQQLAVVYLLVAGAALFIGSRRGLARYPLTVALVVWASSGLIPPSGSAPPHGFRATFFDVGQGDAALVESAGGARVLVDGGPASGVVKDLKRLGIDRLDLVIFSHAHADHIEGLESVLEEITVRKTIEPGIPNRRIERVLGGHKAEIAGEGDRFVIGDLTVDVLGPDATLKTLAVDESRQDLTEGSALNDASLVVRIQWSSHCALFTGDVEEAGQELLTQRHREAIKCAVLKAPHHGSARIVQSFVEAAGPNLVVVSVGPNEYGHPTRTALRLFERVGTRILRTDRLEDVTVELAEDGRAKIS